MKKKKTFKTCIEAFRSIKLKYSEETFACYNEVIGNRKLCPFARTNTCSSEELPGFKKD